MIGTEVSVQVKGNKLKVGNEYSTAILDGDENKLITITDDYAMIDELTADDDYLRGTEVKERYKELMKLQWSDTIE